MTEAEYGRRVVDALNRAEDLCRGLLAHPTAEALGEDTRRRLIELADECDLLAAVPTSRAPALNRRRR